MDTSPHEGERGATSEPDTAASGPAPWQDLGEWLNDDGFDTPPIRSREHPDGKVYRIPSPDAETGIRLAALAEIGRKVATKRDVDQRDLERLRLDDREERDFAQQVLGSAFDTMTADGVPWTTMQRLTRYAYVYFTIGEEAADNALRSGVFAGKSEAPNRRMRRSAARGR